MNWIMMISVVYCILCLLFLIFCARKEADFFAYYILFCHLTRVRILAVFLCALAGFGCIAAGIAGFYRILYWACALIAAGVLLLGISIRLYASYSNRCHEQVRDRCISDLIVIALGVIAKLPVFFIPGIWEGRYPSFSDTFDGSKTYVRYHCYQYVIKNDLSDDFGFHPARKNRTSDRPDSVNKYAHEDFDVHF